MIVEDRVLVWAHARDARLTCGFLEDSGFACAVCRGWEELTDEWHRGAGALLIAGELLTPSSLAGLEAIVGAQPPWGDITVVIVGTEHETDRLESFTRLGNVALLYRPLSLDTLRSTVSAALRARRRQYQVRDLLQQRDDADRRKDEFLAMLAHELRNPLAPLRTGLRLLQLGPPAEVVARTYAMMDRQTANLTRLVDDLLDVSRIARRKIVLKTQVLDIREPVRQAVDAIQHLAREKGLRVEVSLPPEPVAVDADSTRLEQMVGNILNNAIKFTPANGVVHVSVEAVDGQAVLRVRDTGVGIPSEQLDQVFDLFAQTPRTLDRSEGGLGIGLTVVKLVAELHGGVARIFSAGQGAGTEVMIRLPAIQASQRLSERVTSDRVPPCSSRRVLIVEDNHDVAEMLSAYLGQVGHQVIVAHDGHAGLEAAIRHRPHVLICDIGLPGVNGYEIAARLRTNAGFDSCLMIAITGYGEVADRERARRAGFAHHMTKPADPTQVAGLIAAVSDCASDRADDTAQL